MTTHYIYLLNSARKNVLPFLVQWLIFGLYFLFKRKQMQVPRMSYCFCVVKKEFKKSSFEGEDYMMTGTWRTISAAGCQTNLAAIFLSNKSLNPKKKKKSGEWSGVDLRVQWIKGKEKKQQQQQQSKSNLKEKYRYGKICFCLLCAACISMEELKIHALFVEGSLCSGTTR